MSIKETPGDSYKALSHPLQTNKVYKSSKGYKVSSIQITFIGKEPIDPLDILTIKRIVLKACIEPVGRYSNVAEFQVCRSDRSNKVYHLTLTNSISSQARQLSNLAISEHVLLLMY